ncbi:DUF1727 domain-containing protein [Candidatus Gottesmanbacteria bacterium]|nr:DUF1727 domain-containing protein [Candidatus Gottesmanbacteria bacterium]
MVLHLLTTYFSLALIFFGKLTIQLLTIFGIGAGGTWPGEIALRGNPHILSFFLRRVRSGIVLVAGTNGKTTTSKLIQRIVAESNRGNTDRMTIVHNETGANLMNGLISAFIREWRIQKPYDFAVLEVDEASLPHVVAEMQAYKGKVVLVLLNLFRDQLDRYGEVRMIARIWKESIKKLPSQTVFVVNADDPELVDVTHGKKNKYFGIKDPSSYLKKGEHATDSTYCPFCGQKLTYEGIYSSHLGIWRCQKCGNTRPKLTLSAYPSVLPGLYNRYNTLAAVLTAQILGINKNQIKNALENFSPAFGRGEGLIVEGKRVKIFLAKNPAGFNATVRTVLELGAKNIVFLLNDRVPDGRDVSWIWDVDFEMIPDAVMCIASGDRAYDLGLRIKYTHKSRSGISNLKIFETTKEAIVFGLKQMKQHETLYIVPTYSAMLEARKILTGQAIL